VATQPAPPVAAPRAPPVATQPAPPVTIPDGETPAIRPAATLEDRVRSLVRQGGLEYHRSRVQEMVDAGLEPMDVASALMALAGPVRAPGYAGGAQGGKRRRRR